MIDRIPRCLHTCLNCKNAALYEEYSGSSKKIVFDGCWKNKSVKAPVDRETCDNFEEDPERMKRSFWKKWEGRIYIAAGGPGNQDHHINYDAFETARDLLGKREETEVPGSPLTPEQIEEHGSPVHAPLHICELPDRTVETSKETTGKTITEKPGSTIAGSDWTVEIPEKTTEQAAAEENESKKHGSGTTSTHPEKTPTTRSLVLQALANNISKLSDIAFFAGVDPSTVHYHLRNLVRDKRVVKTGWGHYLLSGDQSLDSTFFEGSGRTFEKLLKNFSHPGRGKTGADKLHPVEKNILMDILSKENKYEQFSERELARRNNISRYSAKKYTLNLEKKKLITIKEENNQLVFTPTKIAINGLTSFFDSQKSGSKVDSSKVQPVDTPENSKVQPVNIPGYRPVDPGTLPDQPGNVMETFDEYVAWQQKNAHRLIIQFRLLRCDHNRLKKTGWVFDKKRIHKHFTEAYIFKSKDPSGEFINVLPKHPFIFTSPFEFEDQIVVFVNEVIDRLKTYGIFIDLSEPAEIRLEHAALEDNVFARKVIEKGLLYFQSKIQTIDSTGEVMEYVIAIDKSKKLHLEFEGTEAHHLMENCERFIDDVATGKIKGEDIKKMPQRFQDVETHIKKEFKDIEEKLNSSIQGIEDTQILLHQNQLGFSQNQNSLADAAQKISGAVKSVSETAYSIKETVELLKECFQLFMAGVESLNISHDPFNDSQFSKPPEEDQMNMYERA